MLPSNKVDQGEDRHDFIDRFAVPDVDLPEDYQEGEKWQGLASSLTDLYMHYRRGMAELDVMPTTISSATPSVFASQEPAVRADAQAQLDALSSAVPLIHPSPHTSSEAVDPADVQVQAAMSKTQHQLAIEEGKFWEKLMDPEEVVDHDESTTTAILAFLREKSSFMVQSYLRRNNPPTVVTYDESKNILDAMGVPCIESTGAYEAEALASSLVLNGCADYVASEDTVRIWPSDPHPSIQFTFTYHSTRNTHDPPSLSFYLGRARLRSASPPQHHEPGQSPHAHLGLRGAIRAQPRRAGLRRLCDPPRDGLRPAHPEHWPAPRATIHPQARHDRAHPRGGKAVPPAHPAPVVPWRRASRPRRVRETSACPTRAHVGAEGISDG